MESPSAETPRSPEAKVGLQVEDLWDVQEPQLSSTHKLNACFETIPVSNFPLSPPSPVIDIRSDTSLPEAVKLLSDSRILSAPLVDIEASNDASWIERYIGMVEFAGIVVWILHQSEKMEGSDFTDAATSFSWDKNGPLVSVSSDGFSSPRFRSLHPESPTDTSGNFFEALTSSNLYKNTTVRDISGSFRWAPFLALQNSNSFLTMLLLLSKYRMKSIPVVDLGEAKIENIITQSAVIHMLEECSGLHWFESWGSKKLIELGLPLMEANRIVKVYEDEPVLQAFKFMSQKGIGGVPVVESGGRKAVGNISIRDIQFLLMTPEIFKEYRSITAKNFLTAVRKYLQDKQKDSPLLNGIVTCCRDATLKEVVGKLDSAKIHRIYVVDDLGKLEGVVTLRDIISKLVDEPRGYFGDFFDGVLPLPADSRV
ncbi:kinase modulator [Lithospermum erythrorhizon]|uniref:Kinase modulator n=1 Tax=Lithospermum erythrorhizon TaxID=34254 RepID=A0AAV3PSZ1_LITER